MVDDRTQRPFGANEPARSAPKAGPSGSDPLAELARLIGQSDPFGEFGSNNAHRASAPPAHEPPQAWTDVPQAAPEPAAPMQQHAVPQFLTARPTPSTMPPNFGNHAFGKQAFSKQAFSSPPPSDDMYQVESGAPGYAAAPAQAYENDPYQRDNSQFGAGQDDYYEEEPTSRKRIGILAIAAVFALAIVGTAGAFGYRAIFGSSSSASVPPPVIKADTTPSKIVPVAPKDPQSGKQITDRVNEKGMGERLVSREEQPVAITPQDPVPQAAMPQSPAPSSANGVVGGAEPKKVRTIAIRPDQGMSDAAQSASASAVPPPSSVPAPTSQPTPVRVIPTSKPGAPPQRTASNPPPADEPEPAPRPAAPPRAAANAPLSLNPNAAPAHAAAPAPAARTASLPPAASGGGYLVQVSSQRSEAEAQSAFASLQGKYPGQLGGKHAVIRKVELGEKGTYYRAMVPAGDAAQANQICSGIKAAGGSCLVQKN